MELKLQWNILGNPHPHLMSLFLLMPYRNLISHSHHQSADLFGHFWFSSRISHNVKQFLKSCLLAWNISRNSSVEWFQCSNSPFPVDWDCLVSTRPEMISVSSQRAVRPELCLYLQIQSQLTSVEPLWCVYSRWMNCDGRIMSTAHTHSSSTDTHEVRRLRSCCSWTSWALSDV